MKSNVLGNKEPDAKFCPDCGVEVAPTRYGSACQDCRDKGSDEMHRTLKYACRVCGSLAANRDKFCRFCGLEH